MTTATTPVYDVFLSHGAHDSGVAAIVVNSFREHGLGVYAVTTAPIGTDVQKQVREALADSSAAVILLTRSTINSPNVAFEVGAAMAWKKPVYVLYDGISPQEIPDFVKQFVVLPLSGLPKVVEHVRADQKPLTEEERETLAEVYQKMAVPTDQLLIEPSKLRRLTEEFNRQGRCNVKGEKLIQELIRLRKQGKMRKLKASAS
jgi:hypothetical protein